VNLQRIARRPRQPRAPLYRSDTARPSANSLTARLAHDVCVDDEKNLYVCQWNAGKVYPTKLHRVG